MTASVVQRPYGFQGSTCALSGPIQKILSTFCSLDVRNRLMSGLFKAELFVKIKQKQKQPKPNQQQKQHKTNKHCTSKVNNQSTLE